MSRAVVTWPGLGRPEALRKVVRDMPMLRAVRVMRWAKALSLPPMFSATAVATSLADFTTMALMAVSTVIVSPAFTPSFEGATLVARADTLMGELRVRLPAVISWNSR